MIDYIYGDIYGITTKDFFENPLLDFTTQVSLKTGELCPPDNINRKKKGYKPKDEKTAIYNHTKFIITNDKYINFSGSVHEYFCNGTNHTDFTFQNLFEVTKDLYIKFNINPFLELLHNVEFGVNIKLPFDTKIVLKSILCFKGKEYELRRYKGKGYLLKFIFGQYEFKIYDKGFQKHLPENILRVEIKVRRMAFLRNKEIDINTSADLLNPAIHKELGELLVDFFNQLVMFDPSIRMKDLQEREKEIVVNGKNPKYWTELKSSNRETYKKRLQRFRVVISKYSGLQKNISELVKNKWKFLTQIDDIAFQEIETFLAEVKPETFPKITAQTFPEITAPNSQSEKPNFPQNHPSNSVEYRGKLLPQENSYCKPFKMGNSYQWIKRTLGSEKVPISEARKCKNLKYNSKDNFKNLKQKIKRRKLLFKIDDHLQPIVL